MAGIVMRMLASLLLVATVVGAASLPIAAVVTATGGPETLGYVLLACPSTPEYCPPEVQSRWIAVAARDALQCEPGTPCKLVGALPSVGTPWTFTSLAVGMQTSAPSNLWTWPCSGPPCVLPSDCYGACVR